ncbi:MAG: type III secretion system gatekeeper subunit SctW [Chlamydiia bacterium]|nr:type III secretion system gatekeeper subunit SctW [Chlamydiia bacterium]
MANDEVHKVSGVSQDARIHEAQKAEAKQKLARMDARQVGSQANMEEASELMSFNPLAMKRKFETLNKKAEKPPEGQKTQKSEEEKAANAGESSAVEEIAEDYYQRNPELQKKTLTNLQKEMKPDDTHEQILEKLQKTYTDKALADEAIDFLIETAETKEELKQKYIQAKETFNAQYGREIQAGRNIGVQARAFSEKGLGSPTALRDLYREITGNPRTPHKLFEELVEKFKFSDMKNIIDFILHSLGTDMKAKGPSISKAELQRLFGEARTMQAILGVFRFFFGRMNMIKGQFDRFDLSMPSRINFEVLARLLMKLIEERYPTPDKILKQAFTLGIAEELAAQVIIYTQYRDAMRHLSPKLFKSDRHRQEILMALMETLSDLEDELNEEEDEDEEDEE